MREPSKYQKAIFEFIENDTRNLMVEAVAGSGKTTTIVESLKRIDRTANVLFVAFNKHIAEELKSRVGQGNVTCSTLNAYGWRACRSAWPAARLDASKTDSIVRELAPNRRSWPLARMVGLMKATGVMDTNLLAEKYDVELPAEREEFLALLKAVWAESLHRTAVLDFDDQIFMPVKRMLEVPTYDVVMVDESQDLSPVQARLVLRAGRRVIAVGDSRQAIYGFRGADPEAMKSLREQAKMEVLPLSICYRCPDSHIALAKEIVPAIEGSGKDGVVNSVKIEELAKNTASGDYVLCRTTAPLVKECMKHIAAGRKATVKGRDIGQQLKGFVEKIGLYGTIGEFNERLKKYYDTESAKLIKLERDAALQALEDRFDTIVVLSEGATTPNDILVKIDNVFSDSEYGVVFCTVHRSKGLEGDRVFILRPDLMPFPKAKKEWMKEQEMNLKYVALTRAKKVLTLIEGKGD